MLVFIRRILVFVVKADILGSSKEWSLRTVPYKSSGGLSKDWFFVRRHWDALQIDSVSFHVHCRSRNSFSVALVVDEVLGRGCDNFEQSNGTEGGIPVIIKTGRHEP